MTNHSTPPMAEARPEIITTHGDTRIDEFSWLRNRDDPAAIAYLEAENAHTEAVLLHLEETRVRLFEEIKARVVETDLSVPVRRGPWWYYTRTQEGKSYPIHCRRPAQAGDTPPLDPPADSDEQILYDENVEAEGHDFFGVGVLAMSPDHSMLAASVDLVGDERYTLSFRAVDGGDHPTETIDNVSYGFAWASDSATVFFTRVDDAWRPHQLWRHHVGTSSADDALMLEETDGRFNVGVGRSRDGAVIIVTTASSTTTETSVIDASSPASDLVVACPRVEGVEHGLEHLTASDGSTWWLKVTNEDEAIDFRLDVAASNGAPPSSWATVIDHRPGVRIEGIDAFEEAIVLSERADAETRLRVVPLGSSGLVADEILATSWIIAGDTGPSTTWLGPNPDPSTSTLRFGQTSLIKPAVVAEVDLATHAVSVIKQQEVLGGYAEADFVTYRDWAPAPDGTLIPVSIVHAASLLPSGAVAGDAPKIPAPCLLYGYGSYEISMDPSFSAIRLLLLERGIVFAIAHIRGGGEMGRRWYDQGHLEYKTNSFDDFAAVADHLISRGVTTADRLAARGGSAGGLLMGAVANRTPDRFCALLGEVAFVDALNSMLDPTLPLTEGEYEEWGNPTADPAAYATIKSYAPYENVQALNADGSPRRYPPMLLTGGLNDTRVGFWEPAKLIARLRAANPENPVLLRTEMGVGHGGPSGRYDSWHEEAFVLAWLLEHLGVTEAPGATNPVS